MSPNLHNFHDHLNNYTLDTLVKITFQVIHYLHSRILRSIDPNSPIFKSALSVPTQDDQTYLHPCTMPAIVGGCISPGSSNNPYTNMRPWAWGPWAWADRHDIRRASRCDGLDIWRLRRWEHASGWKHARG